MTFTVIIPEDGKWGHEYSNGSWSGLVGQLHRKEVDFVIAPLTFSIVLYCFIIALVELKANNCFNRTLKCIVKLYIKQLYWAFTSLMQQPIFHNTEQIVPIRVLW